MVEQRHLLSYGYNTQGVFFFPFPCALGYRTLCSTSLTISMRDLCVLNKYLFSSLLFRASPPPIGGGFAVHQVLRVLRRCCAPRRVEVRVALILGPCVLGLRACA